MKKNQNEKLPASGEPDGPLQSLVPTQEQKKQFLRITVTTLKITSESTAFISDFIDFLAKNYHTVPTSRIMKADNGQSFCYVQIFKEQL